MSHNTVILILTALVYQNPENWASWIRTNAMQESKSCALPLGDSPKTSIYSDIHTSCPAGQNLTGLPEGGYRDSNPGPPEPQSGALTNCAIPTIFTLHFGRAASILYLFRKACPAEHEPEGIRTPDPRLRRPLLYPAELQTHIAASQRPARVISGLSEVGVTGLEPAAS